MVDTIWGQELTAENCVERGLTLARRGKYRVQ